MTLNGIEYVHRRDPRRTAVVNLAVGPELARWQIHAIRHNGTPEPYSQPPRPFTLVLDETTGRAWMKQDEEE